jgi:hypothetical protein
MARLATNPDIFSVPYLTDTIAHLDTAAPERIFLYFQHCITAFDTCHGRYLPQRAGHHVKYDDPFLEKLWRCSN